MVTTKSVYVILAIVCLFSDALLPGHECRDVHFEVSRKLLGDHAEGKKHSKKEYTNLEHRGTIKTIESIEDGEVIDCVDIYKQPAFDHPLINELQMEPHSYPSGLEKTNSFDTELLQLWRKKDECPAGTIPIRRTQKTDKLYQKKKKLDLNNSAFFQNKEARSAHEYAQVSTTGKELRGARASINMWCPTTELKETSISQIWIDANLGTPILDTIEAGWQVCHQCYSDFRTRFFIYWSKDNYETGCYDISCPGFVQTTSIFAFGSPFSHSLYNDTLQVRTISVHIYKDKGTGNWWLELQGVIIGYWPKTIFNALAEAATSVAWGGEVVNLSPGGHHTPTDMGSGHFPWEGYTKASFFRNIQVVDFADRLVDPRNLITSVSRPSCYGLTIGSKDPTFGTNFYYGGPGFSKDCQ